MSQGENGALICHCYVTGGMRELQFRVDKEKVRNHLASLNDTLDTSQGTEESSKNDPRTTLGCLRVS